MTECWKPVNGCEGRYEVSDQGRVRSLAGLTIRRDGSPLPRTEKIVTGVIGNHGYLIVGISRRKKLIHRLVLEAFVGPCPQRHEACHNNGIRTDNRLSNLRWGTPQSNQLDRAEHGTSNRGERCAKAKLTEEQVRTVVASSGSNRAWAERFEVDPSTISLIRTGKNWKHLQLVEA